MLSLVVAVVRSKVHAESHLNVQFVWHKTKAGHEQIVGDTAPAITKKNALDKVFPNSWRPEQPAKSFLSGCCMHIMKRVHLGLLCSAES
jgi:hypothetical protein